MKLLFITGFFMVCLNVNAEIVRKTELAGCYTILNTTFNHNCTSEGPYGYVQRCGGYIELKNMNVASAPIKICYGEELITLGSDSIRQDILEFSCSDELKGDYVLDFGKIKENLQEFSCPAQNQGLAFLEILQLKMHPINPSCEMPGFPCTSHGDCCNGICDGVNCQ